MTRGTPARCPAALPAAAPGPMLVDDDRRGGLTEVPGLWSGMQGARQSSIVRPTAEPWRCFALCWSCGAEVPSQGATCAQLERPIRWYCPTCEVFWSAYADRVELPAPVMAR